MTEAPDASRPATVYLCDDVPEVRELVRRLLDASGDLRVIGDTGDPRVAIDEVARLAPDVVVLDLAMPGLDGIEAIPLIRQTAPATRIVVFSGLEEEYAAPTVLKLSADRYVRKGAPLAELLAAVRHVADAAAGGRDRA